MTVHIKASKEPFPLGQTFITSLQESTDATGIALSVLRLQKGQNYKKTLSNESALLLMQGNARCRLNSDEALFERHSLFDDAPKALHAAAGATVEIQAETDVEFTVYETANTRNFPARIYSAVENEHRGKGLLHDASYRYVRTIFDARNAPPEAELVLGEVVTFPGRWSSYPPHHHAQPEIYHYRFTHPQGYGHAELGDTVLKVRHNDTVKILKGVDHPQCAAPGYGMYYAWVIRHLPEAKYGVPEFTPEHAWAMKPDATCWWPKTHDKDSK